MRPPRSRRPPRDGSTTTPPGVAAEQPPTSLQRVLTGVRAATASLSLSLSLSLHSFTGEDADVPPTRVRTLLSAGLVGAVVLAFAAVVVALGGGTAAETAEEFDTADGAAEALEDLAFLYGRWRCTGHNVALDGEPYPVQVDARVAREHDGRWYVWTMRERRTPENPKPLSGTWIWGSDGGRENLVASFHDSLGSRTEQTAPGWQGNELVLEGRIVGQGFQAPYRDLVTRDGDDRFRVVGQGNPAGEWRTFQELDCRRAGPPAS